MTKNLKGTVSKGIKESTTTTKEIDELANEKPKRTGQFSSDQVKCLKCKRIANVGDFCWWHSPDTTEAEKVIVRLKHKEDLSRRTLTLSRAVKQARSPADLHDILDTFITDLTTGRISTSEPAETLIRALRQQHTAIGATITDKRLKALEDKAI